MKGSFQILYTILLTFIKGYVLFQLWSWFITPIYNIPFSYITALAFAMMFTLLNHLPIWKFDDYEEEFKYNLTIGVKPFVLLGLGWIVQHFFM